MRARRIEVLLSRAIGLHSESIGQRALDSAVEQRMGALRTGTREEYEAYVENTPSELALLIEAVVVSETWFFRDEEVFEALARRAARQLRETPARPLRVLSLPCATGEEPYSAAIVLLEAGLAPSSIVVHAADINRPALKVAAGAVYGKGSVRGAPKPAWLRYLEPRGGGDVCVSEAARGLVRFSHANVLGTDLVFAPGEFDVVFCRNLLIYLDRPARARVLDKLFRWLKDDGVLFAGHAEALDSMDPRLCRSVDQGTFAYVKRVSARPGSEAIKPVAERLPRRTPAEPKRAGARAPALVRARNPVGLGGSDRAAPREPAGVRTSLDRARDLADRGDLQGAAGACRDYLRAGEPCAEAYALLGVILNASGDIKAAADCFQKALYLDQTHYDSLIHLALLTEQRGDAAAAGILRGRAERARARGGGR